MNISRQIKIFVLLSSLLVMSLMFTLVAAQDETSTDLVFVSHLALGMPEQDVLQMDEEGTLWRIAPSDPLSLLAQPIYASVTGAEHDPFGVGGEPVGPYEPGEALGFTLGEWLDATGTGTYTVNGDTATLEASFSNLVPNGVYTMWCSRVFTPPDFMIDNKPCGTPDGTENTFVADEDGNATFHLEITPMDDTTDTTLSLFAINFHSDGNTYGANPGNFGHNAHVQILAIVPPSASE